MLTVLQLSHFVPLITIYDFEGRKAMSCYIADDVVETETYIPSVEQVYFIIYTVIGSNYKLPFLVSFEI